MGCFLFPVWCHSSIISSSVIRIRCRSNCVSFGGIGQPVVRRLSWFFPGAVHYLSDVYFRFPDGGGRCQPVVEYVPFTPFDTFPLVCLVFHFVDYGSGSVRAFQSVGVRFRSVHSFGDKFHALRCVGLVNGVRWRKYSRMQQQKASETIELIE